MAKAEWLPLIARVPLFADAKLDQGSLQEIAELLGERSVAAGKAVFREGEAAKEMFLLGRGKVGIFKKTGQTRVKLAELSEGAYFGELALLDGGARSADADALEACELLTIEQQAFDRLIDRHPRVALTFLRATSKRLRDAAAQVAKDASDDDPVRDAYPQPIAAVYRSLSVQVEPRVRLERMFDLLEVTIKYLGYLAVAGHVASGRTCILVDEKLITGIGRLTLGNWLLVMKEITQLHDKDPEKLFVPELHGFLWARPGRPSEVVKNLDQVLDFRNQTRHSASGSLTDKEIEASLAQHLPVLRRALEQIEWIAKYPLLYVERMSFARGAFEYRYQRCMGAHSDFESGTMKLKEPREPGQLYLASRAGDQLLTLHPLLLLDACKVCTSRDVFFLSKSLEDGRVEYVEYTRGHHHASEEPADELAQIITDARARLKAAEAP